MRRDSSVPRRSQLSRGLTAELSLLFLVASRSHRCRDPAPLCRRHPSFQSDGPRLAERLDGRRRWPWAQPVVAETLQSILAGGTMGR